MSPPEKPEDMVLRALGKLGGKVFDKIEAEVPGQHRSKVRVLRRVAKGVSKAGSDMVHVGAAALRGFDAPSSAPAVETPPLREIDRRLDRVSRDFEQRALAYHLFLASNRLGLDKSSRIHLVNEHTTCGEVMACPVLGLANEFEDMARHFDLVEARIEARLFDEETGSRHGTASDRFEQCLLDDAEGKAAEFVRNLAE